MKNTNHKSRIIYITGSGAQGGAEKQLLKLINNLDGFSIFLIVINPNREFINSLKNKDIKFLYQLKITVSSFRKLIILLTLN